MKRKKVRNIEIILIIVLLLVFLCSLCAGNYGDFGEIVRFLVNKAVGLPIDSKLETVLINIRIPRAVASVVIGAALAVSGLVYQNVFSNNMVSPDLLGVSSSAGCGAALSILLGLSQHLRFVYAFIFSIFSIVLTTALSKLLKRKEGLLMAGIVVAGFARSGLGLFKFLSDSENGELDSIVNWELGSMGKADWKELGFVLPVLLIILFVLHLFRRRISCLSFGDNAALLGINVKAERVLAIVFSSLLVSLSTATCGVISWLGLIIPLAVSDMIGSNNIQENYITCGLLGSIFLMLSDTLARSLISSELPISIMTGGIGLVVFCICVAAKKEKKYESA